MAFNFLKRFLIKDETKKVSNTINPAAISGGNVASQDEAARLKEAEDLKKLLAFEKKIATAGENRPASTEANQGTRPPEKVEESPEDAGLKLRNPFRGE